MVVKLAIASIRVLPDRLSHSPRRRGFLSLFLPLIACGVIAADPARDGTLPLELALVLDTSGSLHPAFAGIDAIGYLRTASKQFVTLFDDTKDSMALVQFASGRVVRFQLGKNFTVPISSAIDQFGAQGGTNTHDAIARANKEIETPTEPSAFRAMVLCSDGRPTSFRDIWRIGEIDVDGVIGGMQDPDDPPPQKLFDPFQVHASLLYNTPPGWTTAEILAESWQRTLNAGDSARDDGIAIFTIGLGNPNVGPLGQPDPVLLIALANVESAEDPLNPGDVIINSYFNPDQPRGGFFFATDATGLEEAFESAAQEINSRLTSPPVPVELAGFSATASEEGILLEWSLTELSDISAFKLRRSQDGEDGNYVWLTEQSLEGVGIGARDYSYLDENVIRGTLYHYKLVAIDPGGAGATFGPYPVVAVGRVEFWLSQNTPNPFSRATGTTIHYSVPAAGSVQIRIVDAAGRLIRTLTEEAAAGNNRLYWDGTDHNGRHAASGVYFYRLKAGRFNAERKMLLAD